MPIIDFAPLERGAYDVVAVNSPWPYTTWTDAGKAKSAEAHYRVMTVAEIAALPVKSLLKPKAVVLSWATAPRLPDAIACMAAWGITYVSNLCWRKVTKNGRTRTGCGYWCRSQHELVLIGTVGKPKALRLPSLFDGIAREHSRKPDEFFQLIERRTPGMRRADLFAREYRIGWEAFGDQVDKFGADGRP